MKSHSFQNIAEIKNQNDPLVRIMKKIKSLLIFCVTWEGVVGDRVAEDMVEALDEEDSVGLRMRGECNNKMMFLFGFFKMLNEHHNCR